MTRLCAVSAACFAILVFTGSPVAAQSEGQYPFCGQPFEANAFGRPVDYTDPADREHVAGIEHNHLSRDVALLIRGVTSDSPVDDLAYVLRQVPNHYRALAIMSSFQQENGYRRDYERNNIYTADCYFRRALIFTPHDPVLHLIYGTHLHRAGDLDAALAEYNIAEQIGQPNAELYYNRGLLFVDLEHYEAAREDAKKAYELGYPLNGLKARLNRLGQWTPD